MSKDSPSSALQSLRAQVASSDPDSIADTFIADYRRFGQKFLDRIKEEKILFRIHSIERGNAVSKAMHARVVALATEGKISHDEARHILRFINDHRVIITPKCHIHEYLERSPCWQVGLEDALLAISSEIELQLAHRDVTMQEKLKKAHFDPSIEIRLTHGIAKNILEDGVVIIRESLRRNPRVAKAQINNCRWNDLLTLAERWSALQRIEDRYVWLNHELFIDNGPQFDLVVCRPNSFAPEGSLDFSEYRAAHLDSVRLQAVEMMPAMAEADVAAQILEQISSGIQVNLDGLLTPMPPEIEDYVQHLRSGRRQAVEESHLAILNGMIEHETVVLPILRAWDCLFRLTTLRKLVLDQLPNGRSLYAGKLVLSQSVLIQYFQEIGKLKPQQAATALSLLMFRSDEDTRNSYDPYLRPLISLGGERVLILEAYVYYGRFARNALKLLADLELVNLDVCGRPLEDRFLDILEAAGFKTNKGHRVKIVDSHGSQQTDLDVVGYRDGVLFLGQSKAAIPPGSIYEIYRLLQRLEEAAGQLRSCLENLEINKDFLRSAMGLPDTEAFAIDIILPCILTNDITVTGHKIDGYIVLDPAILDEMLEETALERSRPHALVSELNAFSSRHEEHTNRVVYYELDYGSTVFLIPGVHLLPVMD